MTDAHKEQLNLHLVVSTPEHEPRESQTLITISLIKLRRELKKQAYGSALSMMTYALEELSFIIAI